MKPTNGWRGGFDPIQRWLRVLTTLVTVGVFAALALDPNRDVNDLPILALDLGAALVLLGYEGIIRLPFLDRKDGGDRER